eukprot:5222548-Pleurochrysis_carterae.AAC.2
MSIQVRHPSVRGLAPTDVFARERGPARNDELATRNGRLRSRPRWLHRRLFAQGERVQIGARVDEQLRHVGPALGRGDVQRRLAALRDHDAGRCAMLQQELHGLCVARARRRQQRRDA